VKRLACICTLLVLNNLVAADWPNGATDKHADVDVVIANRTSSLIHETGVQFGKQSCTAGIVGAGSFAGYLGWRHSITTNAVVRWTDANKMQKQQTVSLVGVYDPKVTGALTFTIGATNVTVSFEKIDRK